MRRGREGGREKGRRERWRGAGWLAAGWELKEREREQGDWEGGLFSIKKRKRFKGEKFAFFSYLRLENMGGMMIQESECIDVRKS